MRTPIYGLVIEAINRLEMENGQTVTTALVLSKVNSIMYHSGSDRQLIHDQVQRVLLTICATGSFQGNAQLVNMSRTEYSQEFRLWW